jgi:hypothetical protein
MKKGINIHKTYIVNKTVEQSFAQLDAVISSPYNNSKFATEGSLESADPPEFLLMLKCAGYFGNYTGDTFSTKLSARLLKSGEKTQIEIRTRTNPINFVFLIFSLLNGFAMAYNDKQHRLGTALLLNLLLALAILGFDRFVKGMLIAGFEDDFGITIQ